jgi:hypothetical protein
MLPYARQSIDDDDIAAVVAWVCSEFQEPTGRRSIGRLTMRHSAPEGA